MLSILKAKSLKKETEALKMVEVLCKEPSIKASMPKGFPRVTNQNPARPEEKGLR